MILSTQCIKCISFTLHLTLINGQLLIYSPKHMRPQISTISAQITYQLSMQLSPRTSANRQWMRHRTNNPHKYSDICFRHWLFQASLTTNLSNLRLSQVQAGGGEVQNVKIILMEEVNFISGECFIFPHHPSGSL